jgi:hypothetical protein
MLVYGEISDWQILGPIVNKILRINYWHDYF